MQYLESTKIYSKKYSTNLSLLLCCIFHRRHDALVELREKYTTGFEKAGDIFLLCKKRLPDQPYHRLCGARQIVDIGQLPSSEKIKSNDFIKENTVQCSIQNHFRIRRLPSS